MAQAQTKKIKNNSKSTSASTDESILNGFGEYLTNVNYVFFDSQKKYSSVFEEYKKAMDKNCIDDFIKVPSIKSLYICFNVCKSNHVFSIKII